jgi:hypothetical protein
VDVARRDVLCQRDAARPQLRPVREELLVLEERLVDQLVGARRAEQRQRLPGEVERLLDQSAA